MESPDGTLIAFATEPGNFATDGEEGNSPYTKALVAAMRQPGLGVYDTFNQAGIAVRQATNGTQRPWFSSSAITGSFYFAAPPAGRPAVDEIVWNALKDTNDVAALRRFMAEYPGSPRLGEARTRLAALAAPSLPSRVADVRRFDGVWMAINTCESNPSGVPGWRNEFVARVRDGIFHGQRGSEGKPGSETFDGMITSGGDAEISHRGFSGEKEKDPFHRPKGTEYRNTYVGSFNEAHGMAIRTDRASCNLDVTKQAEPRVALATPPSDTSDLRRFDGSWITTIVCAKIGEVQGWSDAFIVDVKDGVLHGQKGTDGRPGWITFDGRIKPNGSTEIVAKGLTAADTKFNLNHTPPNAKFTWSAAGRFEDSHGSAIRVQGRVCNFDFVKQ
jgi:caspase domain-containing protein